MGFFKTFSATLLAIVVAVLLFFAFGAIIIISSQQEAEPYVREGSVLEVKMGNTLTERPPDDPFSMLFREDSRVPVTLRGLESNLEKAAADDRIEGVWLRMNNIVAPWANLIALREKMIDFRKETGKFIYVSTDDIGFNEHSYYLATAADSIFSPPETFFELDGFSMQTVFIKEFLDKVGVEAEVFRAGEYKGAVEPLIQKELSEENREQLQAIVDNIADTFQNAVMEHTGKSRSELDALMNNDPILTSRGAYEAGLIDKMIYPDDMKSRIEEQIKQKGHSELHTVAYHRYNKVEKSSAGVREAETDNKIAVIYASGNIMPEVSDSSPISGSADNITADNFGENLDAALEDDDIKAIVLRITSPGGAGSTSDLIWHQIREASGKKPVIASFGSVAASGGYYIGMAADTIVASSHSITGSIGVFGVVMNMQELLNEKLGIHFDNVSSHDHSLWITPDKPMSEAARRTLQNYIDEFYDVFLERVAVSRNMDVDAVHEVAQGRVWTGSQAQDVGLVDAIGELDMAMEIAAEKAGIDEYTVESFPKPKTLMEMFVGSTQTRFRYWLYPGLKELEYLDPIFHILQHDSRSVIARIPFDHKIH